MTGVLLTMWRVLTFQFTREDIEAFGYGHLAAGLFVTWLVGIGRYWDNPRVGLLQHLGVGSVVYVFVLAAWLWLVIWPLRPERLGYRTLLTFLTLTAAPAALYAIPIEGYMPVTNASNLNILFLAIVSIWRVALWCTFLYRWSGFREGTLVCAAICPLALIVVALAWLNLDRAVFEIMAGIHDRDHTPNDGTYFILLVLSWLTTLASPLLLLGYGGVVASRWTNGSSPSTDE